MITKRKSRRGEGELVTGDPEVGLRRRTTRGKEMVEEGRGEHPFRSDVGFVDSFMTLRSMVDDMYCEFKKLKEEDKPKDEEEEASLSEKTKDEEPSNLGQKIKIDDDKKRSFIFSFWWST